MHTNAYNEKSAQNPSITNSIEGTIIGAAREGSPPQSKCHQQQICDKKVLFRYFQFVLASSRTTVQ